MKPSFSAGCSVQQDFSVWPHVLSISFSKEQFSKNNFISVGRVPTHELTCWV